jgi:multiple sugar transport system substrate-binding protein
MSSKQMAGALLGTALLLSACGAGKEAPVAGNDPVPIPKDPVELSVYFPFPADWPEEEFMKTFGQPIMNKFPHIKINYLAGGKIPELLAAGQTIDILFASIGASPTHLIENKLEYDITPQLKTFHYNLGQLEPTMVDIAKQLAGGKGMYGLPVYTPPSAIYYNKDIFDKFGVPYPKDGMTWDQMYDLGKSLTRTDAGVAYYGLGSSQGHLAMMNQLSIPLVLTDSKKSTFDTDPRWNAFADNLIRFYKLPGFADIHSKQISETFERNRFFKDRTVAMFLALTALHTPQELGNLNWDLASFPVFKEKPDVGPQAYPTYFFVTSMSPHKDQAFEAIAYLTSEEYQAARLKEGKFLTASSNKSLRQTFGQNNPVYAGKNVKAFQPDKYAPTGSVNKYNGNAIGEFNTVMKDIVFDNKDVNTALREAAERVNKQIQAIEAAAAKP